MLRQAAPALACVLCFWGALPAAAQLDEQPPVLKRGDNGNGSPGGSRPGRSKSESAKDTTPAVVATGVVRAIDANKIQVEAEDTRILTCKLTKTTTFSGPSGKVTSDDIEVGMRVHVRARTDEDGEDLTATSVTIENSSEKPAGDEKTVTVLKTPAEDDEDRPVLRHGVPPKRKKADDDDDDAAAAPARPTHELSRSAPRMDEESEPIEKPKPANLIDKAREANGEFTEHLPSFVCQQFTTRYGRESRQSGWAAQDVVSATVVYADGKESYENVKVGNKAVKKDMMDIKGQRSVGEFGSVLHSLFERAPDDEFHFVKDQEVKRLSTKVYDFTIRREISDWNIIVSGQSIIPGYSGRVWIDKESGRVLRLERQADKIPSAFPMDTIEQTIDYDFVLIGGKKILLPSESENLACQRDTPMCGKNVIEFRDYKQFRGDASITFDK